MSTSLARYGNILENMQQSKWSYDFGLYKYSNVKKSNLHLKLIVGVAVVSVSIIGVSRFIFYQFLFVKRQ